MKSLILFGFFLVVSCAPLDEAKPPESEKTARPKADPEPQREEQESAANAAPKTPAQAKNSPPALANLPTLFPVCDRTSAVRSALVKTAGSWWDPWNWLGPSCEDLTIQDLKKIEELDLSNSGLSYFKIEDFENLPALKVLDVSENLIYHLKASWFSKLPQLEELRLRNNRINQLDPKAFEGLTNLKKLSLHGNKIQILPETLIAHMTLLEVVHLSDNILTSLPPNFFLGFQNLERVYLQNNLFKGPMNCEAGPESSNRICRF